MLKAVFRPQELVALPDRHIINSPTSFPDLAHLAPVAEVVEDSKDVDEYTGPTADDLRREAEMFKSNWEEEKEKMISAAKAEAEGIISDAQKAAFNEIKRKTDEAQVIKQQAEEEAQRIADEAKIKAAELQSEVKKNLESERKEAREKGREDGHGKGFEEGKAEVERLIERTRVVLERAQDKRAEILSETEQEIVDLVLLISRKVIKVISENQRNVIISNVVQALRKVKAKGDVIIRVNMNDLQLTTEHKQEFIKLLEGAKSIQVIEDSSVDSGGCIIETDFGEIDARISSQLSELESKILEISPFKSTIKNDVPLKNINASGLASGFTPDQAVSL
jgi:flagellar assembly protein FliH